MRGAGLREQRVAFLVQPDEWLVPGTVINGDGTPAQFRADACGERLRDRLLRGKPRGQVQIRRLVTETIRALLLGENPLDKTLPLPLEHAPNPLDLDDIAAEAEEFAARRKNKVHGETAGSERRLVWKTAPPDDLN